MDSCNFVGSNFVLKPLLSRVNFRLKTVYMGIISAIMAPFVILSNATEGLFMKVAGLVGLPGLM